MLLRVGNVDGFYATWSPSISTDSVKVLTNATEHSVNNLDQYGTRPPTLGNVGEWSLTVTTKAQSKLVEFDEDFSMRKQKDTLQKPLVDQRPGDTFLAVSDLAKNIRFLQTPIWCAVALLLLLYFKK